MTTEMKSEDQQKEAEQMQNILLLLNHLVENEETTLKLIIDCLYEVGTVNLINQKIAGDRQNRIARTFAGMSKPAAKAFALRWFKKNCPELIVKWLRSKVSFKSTKAPKTAPPKTEVQSSQKGKPDLPLKYVASSSQIQEIKQLRSQVRVLSGLLLCTMTVLGGTAMWQVYQVGVKSSPAQPELRPVTTFPRGQGQQLR